MIPPCRGKKAVIRSPKSAAFLTKPRNRRVFFCLNESHLRYDCKCSFSESPEKVLETLTSKQNHRKAPKRKKNGKERGKIAVRDLRCNHDRSAPPSAHSSKTDESLPSRKNGSASSRRAVAAPHSVLSSKDLTQYPKPAKMGGGSKNPHWQTRCFVV